MEEIIKQIIAFYKSAFYKDRYWRRLNEEGISILKTIDSESLFKEVTFKEYIDSKNSNGLSYGKIIEINSNKYIWNQDADVLLSLVMHEFGHIQYREEGFRQVRYLNKLILKTPSPIGLETDSDISYFSDLNEIRLRIIPLVFKMWDNNWSAEETYNNVCKYDDIFSLYKKEDIIYWIDNIL